MLDFPWHLILSLVHPGVRVCLSICSVFLQQLRDGYLSIMQTPRFTFATVLSYITNCSLLHTTSMSNAYLSPHKHLQMVNRGHGNCKVKTYRVNLNIWSVFLNMFLNHKWLSMQVARHHFEIFIGI
jgi:hypothetical protein